MSLKKRIKIINTIDSFKRVQKETTTHGEEVEVICFPIKWWNELKLECEK